MRTFFPSNQTRRPRAAIFLSGGGSNAGKLLESLKGLRKTPWEAVCLITDAPTRSRAGEMAEEYGLPLVALDIREFYHARGEHRISIRTEAGRAVREQWTNELRKLIAPFEIDFGLLAGFVPLTNITGDFPCLNIHPGDLTVEDASGVRTLTGLHTIPVETAILSGTDHLRSSAVVVQPYTGAGGEMDTGPVPGVSGKVPIDLMGYSLKKLRDLAAARPAPRPPGGFKDILETVAAHNQERLKACGDWKLFPRVAADFAAGKFALDDDGRTMYFHDNAWLTVKTVIYKDSGPEPVPIGW